MNLWTVGCADPRLTAQARSPMDKPGKTHGVSPGLPTGRRLPTSFTAPPQQHGMNLISGKVNPSVGIPALAYSPRKLSKQPEPSHNLARDEQPDLILMDIKLPDICGFDVTRLLK